MEKKAVKTFVMLVMSMMLVGVTMVGAQTPKEVDKLEKKSYKAFIKKDYAQSLVYLLKLDSLGDNPYYDYMIGMCLMSGDDKTKAIPYLERAKQSGQISFVVDYYLGRAYQFTNRYEEARVHFMMYINELNKSNITLRTERVVEESHRIHVEKKVSDVYGFIAECDLMQSNTVD